MALLLPTFFIIGAAKAGTTSLHAYLGEHPGIAMTTRKEPGFFEYGDWERQLVRYEALFSRAAPVRGESSTAYSAYPWIPDIPNRVRKAVPDAKILYLVRDPVERALSQYAQDLHDRVPVRPWSQVIRDLDDPTNSVVHCSRYATQLSRWLDEFGDSQVLVVDRRELLCHRYATIRQVLCFLDVDASYTSARWSEEHNVTARRRQLRPWAQRMRVPARALATRRLVPLLTRSSPSPLPNSEQRAALMRLFAPEADQLRTLTGLKFADWCV